MARTADTEIFLRSLPDDGSAVGNGNLKSILGWDSDRYERAKALLLESGDIVRARGYGGSVMRRHVAAPKVVRIFISYSHADSSHQGLLLKHLQPLVREELVQIWTDGVIKPGDEWDKAIELGLTEADLILLLVSIDFLNSDYIYSKEMKRAVERHDRGEAKVVPLIVRPCSWSIEPFAKLQALPKGPQGGLVPVELWPHREEAFDKIAGEIRKTVGEILRARRER